MSAGPRVIIEVSGGVVAQVYSDYPVSVTVLDHDSLCAETTEQINSLCKEVKELHPRL